MKAQQALAAALGLLAAVATAGRADEGMWPYNALPKQQIQQKYGFTLSDAWAQHLQRASVRFDNGGSGSFISADGLVMTNQHVALDTLQKLSTSAHNYAATGFYARTHAEELKAPDLELDVLDSIAPITDRVNAAIKPGMTAAQEFLARRAAIAAITKDSEDRTGLRSDVVTLFGGARYDLYRYKRYTDVRLVMAPEQNMAFFGGDPNNFEYPRYDLDMSFFRVYESGKPAQVKDYLTWSKSGAKEGDLVFVSGNPARTSRLYTVSDVKFDRDYFQPLVLDDLRREEVLLQSWGARLPENARAAKKELKSVQNERKLRTGQLQGLQDPAVIARKQTQEQALRAKVAADPKLQAAYGDTWTQVERANVELRALITKYQSLTVNNGELGSALFDKASTLVFLAEEDQKPDGQRLPEYSDSNRQQLELALFSPAPISTDFEQIRLADALAQAEEEMGADNPLVVSLLAGESPQQRATELVMGTKLADVSERRRLATGGSAATQSSPDPMIQFARLLEPTLRAIRNQEDDVEGVRRQAYTKIAEAQAATGGGSLYPDATFTPRLAFGTVTGYAQNGKAVPPMTKMGEIFAYAAAHDNLPPFQPSASWVKARKKITPDTPFDFVCTADIIGGNSGSPVVNRDGELVGLIFDGNIQSLVSDYVYTDTQARAIAVASPAITEALRHVYGDDALADEIVSGHTD